MESLNNKELADKIRKLGQQRGLMSDAAICDKAGITNRMAIKNIDEAKNAPRVDTLMKLATALDVSIESLIYPDLHEIDDEIYKDITDAVDKFLKEHKLTMSAKKRRETVMDFYQRGYDGERIAKELLNWQRIFFIGFTKKDNVA